MHPKNLNEITVTFCIFFGENEKAGTLHISLETSSILFTYLILHHFLLLLCSGMSLNFLQRLELFSEIEASNKEREKQLAINHYVEHTKCTCCMYIESKDSKSRVKSLFPQREGHTTMPQITRFRLSEKITEKEISSSC